MTNNYSNEQENQHEHAKFTYEDYIEEAPTTTVSLATVSHDSSADEFVEIEMSRSIHDMRREFGQTLKKFRKELAQKELRTLRYQYQFHNAAPARIHLEKKHAIG